MSGLCDDEGCSTGVWGPCHQQAKGKCVNTLASLAGFQSTVSAGKNFRFPAVPVLEEKFSFLFVRQILHNILDRTVENPAQRLQGVGGNRIASF